jgi:hypothetical protein
MSATVLLEKLGGLFSGSLLVSGVLPALIAAAYVAVIVGRFHPALLPELWKEQATVVSVGAALVIVVMTFVFESLHPLLKRWLMGDWVPRAWLRARQRERRRTEYDSLRAIELWNAGRNRTDGWMRTISGALGPPRPPGPVTDRNWREARGLLESVRHCFPAVETAEAEVDAHLARAEALRTVLVRDHQPWPDELVLAYQELALLVRSVEPLLLTHARQANRRLRSLFPSNEAVRGTRFGNVMAAIDAYPFTRYGIDGALLWPRLREAVKDDTRWKGLDDTRARVDFLAAAVWIHVAVVVVAVLLAPLLLDRDPALLLALVAAGVLFRFVFYRAALQALEAYGLQMATAFDLYRWTLLDSLRLPRPATAADERSVWSRVSIDAATAGVDITTGKPAVSGLWYR